MAKCPDSFHGYFKQYRKLNEWFDLPKNYKEQVKVTCKIEGVSCEEIA